MPPVSQRGAGGSGGTEIAAVCDVGPAKAKAAADGIRVPYWYSDTETMFRGPSHQAVGDDDEFTNGAP